MKKLWQSIQNNPSHSLLVILLLGVAVILLLSQFTGNEKDQLADDEIDAATVDSLLQPGGEGQFAVELPGSVQDTIEALNERIPKISDLSKTWGHSYQFSVGDGETAASFDLPSPAEVRQWEKQFHELGRQLAANQYTDRTIRELDDLANAVIRAELDFSLAKERLDARALAENQKVLERSELSANIENAKALLQKDNTQSRIEVLESIGYLLTDRPISGYDDELKQSGLQIVVQALEDPETLTWLLADAEKYLGKTTHQPEHIVLEYWALSQAYSAIGNDAQASDMLDQAFSQLKRLDSTKLIQVGTRLAHLLVFQEQTDAAVRALKIIEGAAQVQSDTSRSKHFAYLAALAHLLGETDLAEHYLPATQKYRSIDERLRHIAFFAYSRQFDKLDDEMDYLERRVRTSRGRNLAEAAANAALYYAAEGLEEQCFRAIRIAKAHRSFVTDWCNECFVLSDGLLGEFERAEQQAVATPNNSRHRNIELSGLAILLALHNDRPEDAVDTYSKGNYANNSFLAAFTVGFAFGDESPEKCYWAVKRNQMERARLSIICGYIVGRQNVDLFRDDFRFVPW